jgi:hypothetical protein
MSKEKRKRNLGRPNISGHGGPSNRIHSEPVSANRGPTQQRPGGWSVAGRCKAAPARCVRLAKLKRHGMGRPISGDSNFFRRVSSVFRRFSLVFGFFFWFSVFGFLVFSDFSYLLIFFSNLEFQNFRIFKSGPFF